MGERHRVGVEDVEEVPWQGVEVYRGEAGPPVVWFSMCQGSLVCLGMEDIKTQVAHGCPCSRRVDSRALCPVPCGLLLFQLLVADRGGQSPVVQI